MKKIFAFLFAFLLLQAAAFANSDFVAGYKAFEKEDYSSAIKFLQKSKADSGFILPEYANFFIAKSYYHNFKFASAEAFAKAVIASKNKVLLPDAYILIGKCRLDSHRNKAAANAFGHLIKNYPGSRLEALAYYLLAEANKRQNKNKTAYRLYYHIDTYFPLSAYAKKSRINMRKLEKKYGYRAPGASAKDLYNKGRRYWKSYDFKNATAVFTKLMKQHPKSKYVKSALYMTGLAEYETRDYVSAINTLQRNIRARGPHRQNSYYYLGRAYGRRGKYQKAMNTLHYFISLYPKSPLADNAYYYIGYYHEIEDEFDSAVVAYENLLKTYPESPLTDGALWRLGRIYYRAGKKEYARRYFAQAFNYPVGTDTPKCIYWWGKLTEEINKGEAASIYAFVINNFDHSYYSYRADERLKKLGYKSPLNYGVIKQRILKEEKLPEKAKLLLEAGLSEYAKYETGPAPDGARAGLKSKNSYQASLGLVLHKYGEYRAPIGFAEKKVKGAILKGEAGSLPKSTWQLAYPKGFWTYVENEASVYGLDPYLILALIREESRFSPKARSRSYARGLMQIISPTARRICKQLGMSYYYRNLYKPKTNIKMGTYYLSGLIDRFNGNIALALAGYNGGPVRVKKWINEWYNGNTSGIDLDDFVINIPIRETRNYVEKVLGSYYQYKRIYD